MLELTVEEQALVEEFKRLTEQIIANSSINQMISKDREDVVAELYALGRTQAEVGDILGLSQSRIEQILKKRSNRVT